MAGSEKGEAPGALAAGPAPGAPRRPPPQGYRQGLVTAVTVLLGFSLSFLRFWGFEAPGEWTLRSAIAATTLGVAVVLQIVALARSLRIEDDDEVEFSKTVRWLVASAIVLLGAVALALFIDSGVLGGGGWRPRPR